MTQAERDRLVTLKKAKKKVITQRDAAEELGLSIRQVKRLLYGLKKRGDKAVVHGLRGKPSNRRMEESTEKDVRGGEKRRHFRRVKAEPTEPGAAEPPGCSSPWARTRYNILQPVSIFSLCGWLGLAL